MNILLNLQHEILLTALFLVLLTLKLVRRNEPGHKGELIFVNLALIGVFLAGFIPGKEAALFDGMYQTDETLRLQKNLLNLGLVLVSLQAWDWLKSHHDTLEFYMMLLVSVIGMYFMISSGHFLIFFLGLELATLPVVAMAGFEKQKSRSTEAGLKLVLTAAFSSAILLMGLSILYGVIGSLHFPEVAAAMTDDPINVLAMVLIFAAFAFKISLVPFHLWTADVFEGSPVIVTAFLAVVSKSAVIFIFITVLFEVFGNVPHIWQHMLGTLAVISMVIGNLFALRQENIKRFLAFSSIAQAGYILLGIMAASAMGMAATKYFILIYIFSNLAAFGVVSTIAASTGKENISDYRGLYQTNPKLGLLMLLSMFSLAGMPPVAGFFGKFFLLMSAAGAGFYIIVLIATLNMIISLYYYLRIVKTMFIDTTEDPVSPIKSTIFSKASLTVCAAAILVIGLMDFVYDYIEALSFGI